MQSAGLAIEVDIDVDCAAYCNIPTAVGVAPGKVLDGRFGLSFMAPISWRDVEVGIDAKGDAHFSHFGRYPGEGCNPRIW
jgi:hypothetical protein